MFMTLGEFRKQTKDLPDETVMATYSELEEGGGPAERIVFQCAPEDEEGVEEGDGKTPGTPMTLGYGGDDPWYDNDDLPETLLTIIS